MKTQKSTAITIFLLFLAVFYLFTGCEQPSDPKPQTVAKPTATPAGGSYTTAQTVTLTTKTKDAAICYTLDGTTPTASSTLYLSVIITISETKTLKAVAVKSGWTNSEMLTETYTITSTAPTTFTSITDVSNYLASLPSNTKDNPVSLTININLDDLYSGWRELLRAIDTAGKYVNLDLSACTMEYGTLFNSGSYSDHGKDRIVYLVLPAAARSMGNFNYFTNLKSISGANIITIGGYAFYGLSSITGVDFPQATTIGYSAFNSCTSLKSVSLPQATNIDESAFFGCTSLQSISLPQATNIGYETFKGCTSLQSVNIPKVTTISMYAFHNTGTTTLSITMGPAAPTLFALIFSSTSAKTVTVKVPAGATGYTPFTGATVTVSGTDTTANWANGLRGGGWDETTWNVTVGGGGPESINQNISVIIERQ